MQEMEQNEFQPHTPQFRGPSMKMNLNINHCQSAAPPRNTYADQLVESAPINPFEVKISSFDPEGDIKPKLAAEPNQSFARKPFRKYSINENEFSNDIFTKVNNKNDCMRDTGAERQFVDFN